MGDHWTRAHGHGNDRECTVKGGQMASKQTDKQAVLEYLREHQTITPLEAFSKLGCYRLGARIYDLRCEGHYDDG